MIGDGSLIDTLGYGPLWIAVLAVVITVLIVRAERLEAQITEPGGEILARSPYLQDPENECSPRRWNRPGC